MPRVVRREPAKRDLTRHFAYLGEQAGIEVGDHFLKAAEAAFADLSRMPLMGAPAKLRRKKYAGIRIWPVLGFRRYLIIYSPLIDGVQIERVIHGAEDYTRLPA